jgi:hypothetical protein
MGAMSGQAVPLVSGVGGVVALLWSLGFFVSGLKFVALAALFLVAIHVEENTRSTAQCLEKLRPYFKPREENVGPLFRS